MTKQTQPSHPYQGTDAEERAVLRTDPGAVFSATFLSWGRVPNQSCFYWLQFMSVTFSSISNCALSPGVFSLTHCSGFSSLKTAPQLLF